MNGWQPIETAPTMRKVIVHYVNALGKHRCVMACYYLEHSLEMHDDYADVGIYDEVSGESYAPAGWYEEHDTENPIIQLQGEPTHWMPLPKPPSAIATVVSGDGMTVAQWRVRIGEFIAEIEADKDLTILECVEILRDLESRARSAVDDARASKDDE